MNRRDRLLLHFDVSGTKLLAFFLTKDFNYTEIFSSLQKFSILTFSKFTTYAKIDFRLKANVK